MTKFLTTFEITGGVVRLYDAARPPPAEYLLAVDIVGDEGTAIVKALIAAGLTAGQCAAVRYRLRQQRFHTVRWTRRDPQTGLIRPTSVRIGPAPGEPGFNVL